MDHFIDFFIGKIILWKIILSRVAFKLHFFGNRYTTNYIDKTEVYNTLRHSLDPKLFPVNMHAIIKICGLV